MWTLATALQDPALLARTQAFVERPRATLRPDSQDVDSPAVRSIPAADVAAVQQRLRIERRLGEGGMGVVHEGEQLALRRKVAVKAPRLSNDSVRDARSARSLLQEAWVAGALEHPNIVPVHDLYMDANGHPHIVLKRIDGKPWSDSIHRPDPTSDESPEEVLERDLEIFLQVCQAVAFAHGKNIIHRDIKPENVMVGEFGEVIVLDWGIALTTDPELPHVPHVSTATQAAGTPAYMAPEMLGGETPQVGTATDVYLLGATLFEVACGRPPHHGERFDEVMRSILSERPQFEPGVAEELQHVIERAMHPSPALRFESVTALRDAVRAFVRHQGSRRLVQAAAPRRDALLVGIEASKLGKGLADEQVHALFSECRFAYAEALRSWPENPEAHHALHELTLRVVEHQLTRDEPRMAAATLSSLGDPPSSLKARVEAAMRQHDDRMRALESLARQRDPSTGARTRTVITLLFGLLWMGVPLSLLLSGVPERDVLWVSPSIFLAVGAAVMVWARESLTKTAINRFLAGAVGATFIVQIAYTVVALSAGLNEVAILQLTYLVWALAATLTALNVDPRLFLVVAAYLLGFVVSLLAPAMRWYACTTVNLMVMVGVIVLWAPPGLWSDRPAWLRMRLPQLTRARRT